MATARAQTRHPRSLHRPDMSKAKAVVTRLMPSSNRISLAREDVVVIAVDANKDKLASLPTEIIIKRGDRVVLLGILHYIATPMGYKSQADVSAFIGTNKKALEAEINKKMDLFEQKSRPLTHALDEMGAHFDITITAGVPLKSVLVKEALKLNPTHLILEWSLRKDMEYYRARLQCQIVCLQGSDGDVTRDNNVPCLYNPRRPAMKQKPTRFPALSSHVSPATSVSDSGSNMWSDRSTVTETSATSDCPMSEMERNLPISREEYVAPSECPSTVFPDNSVDGSGKEASLACVASAEADSYCSSPYSPLRDESFDDHILNSPVISIWSQNETERNLAAPPYSSNWGESKLKTIDTSTKMVPYMKELGYKIYHTEVQKVASFSTSSALRGLCSSNQNPYSSLHPISVQPKRQFLELNELLKVHDFEDVDDSDEDEPVMKPEGLHQGSNLDYEEALPAKSRMTDAIQEASKTFVQDFHKQPYTFNNTVDIGRSLAQPPPLCPICKLKSPELGKSPKLFQYEELKVATNDFSSDNLIAQGGFGFVYKGTLLDGQVVAVKKLKALSLQGDIQFSAEVEALSCAQHRNLVRLIGYCMEFEERVLVYEYVCNGSLDRHLSGVGDNILKWPSRYKIAVGAARGLRYLHEECRVGCIVHCDMRPNNILLTHDFTPMVGDFGLAKLNSNGDVAVETKVIGSLGYVAPEYIECGQVTAKTDVYSFGVVLLELITGKKALDLSRAKEDLSLTKWARPKLDRLRGDNQMDGFVDMKIITSLDMCELARMAEAASLCIKMDPSNRPGMSQILRILEGDGDGLRCATSKDLFPTRNSTEPAGEYQIEENGGSNKPLDVTTSRLSTVSGSQCTQRKA